MPQCQLLFSAVFVFQKIYSENILEIGRNESTGSYFSITYTESEGDTKGTEEAATPRGSVPPFGRATAWRGPLGFPPTSPFRLYICFIGKTLDTRASIHEKFRSRRRRQP